MRERMDDEQVGRAATKLIGEAGALSRGFGGGECGLPVYWPMSSFAWSTTCKGICSVRRREEVVMAGQR